MKILKRILKRIMGDEFKVRLTDLDNHDIEIYLTDKFSEDELTYFKGDEFKGNLKLECLELKKSKRLDVKNIIRCIGFGKIRSLILVDTQVKLLNWLGETNISQLTITEKNESFIDMEFIYRVPTLRDLKVEGRKLSILNFTTLNQINKLNIDCNCSDLSSSANYPRIFLLRADELSITPRKKRAIENMLDVRVVLPIVTDDYRDVTSTFKRLNKLDKVHTFKTKFISHAEVM